MTIIKKLWGEERVIVNNEHYCGKILFVLPGFRSSLHYHLEKRETFYVLEGHGHAILNHRHYELVPGTTLEVPATAPHCFWVERNEAMPLEIAEFSTHHDDADVVRLEPSRKL